jgi:hypothetical protein
MSFTEDAISTTKYRNIGLVELREFEKKIGKAGHEYLILKGGD